MQNLLDVRREADFLAGHIPGAANVPLEELRGRLYELPAPAARVVVMDADTSRAQQAAAVLRERRYDAQVRLLQLPEATEIGPQRVQLWQPSPFLIEALQRIDEDRAPRGAGSAADIACGSGREAVWLAMRGWQIDAIDVLPDAVDMAAALALRCDVAGRVRGICSDVKTTPLASNAYDLVVTFRFLHRPLLPRLASTVRRGGYVIYETFHERTATVGQHPRSPEHLLGDNELPRLLSDLQPLIARDAVERDGRYFSQLLARRP